MDRKVKLKLCVMVFVARVCPPKSKIPVVAIVAAERTDQKDGTHDSFQHAPFMGPVHQVAAAPWANLTFSKLYWTHKAAFNLAHNLLFGYLAAKNDQALSARGNITYACL